MAPSDQYAFGAEVLLPADGVARRLASITMYVNVVSPPTAASVLVYPLPPAGGAPPATNAVPAVMYMVDGSVSVRAVGDGQLRFDVSAAASLTSQADLPAGSRYWVGILLVGANGTRGGVQLSPDTEFRSNGSISVSAGWEALGGLGAANTWNRMMAGGRDVFPLAAVTFSRACPGAPTPSNMPPLVSGSPAPAPCPAGSVALRGLVDGPFAPSTVNRVSASAAGARCRLGMLWGRRRGWRGMLRAASIASGPF
jgi:hypothetical protein